MSKPWPMVRLSVRSARPAGDAPAGRSARRWRCRSRDPRARRRAARTCGSGCRPVLLRRHVEMDADGAVHRQVPARRHRAPRRRGEVGARFHLGEQEGDAAGGDDRPMGRGLDVAGVRPQASATSLGRDSSPSASLLRGREPGGDRPIALLARESIGTRPAFSSNTSRRPGTCPSEPTRRPCRHWDGRRTASRPWG